MHEGSNGWLSIPNGHDPLPSPRSASFGLAVEDTLRQKLAEENDEAHCLMCLNVRNVYGVPFEVTLTRMKMGGERGVQSVVRDATLTLV